MKHLYWEIAEYISVGASALGTIAAALSHQAAYAAAPVTLALSLNIVNRQQLQKQTKEAIALSRQQTELNAGFNSLPKQEALTQITTQLNTLEHQFNNLIIPAPVSLSECGEPVYYRKGPINQPHFAHFPSINPQKYEECLHRQQNASDSLSPNYNWWDEQNGKGQRLQLFQKNFILIIKSKIPDLDTQYLQTEPQKIEFNELQAEAFEFARSNRDSIFRYVRVFSEKAIKLEREIICEAFDYLIVASSRNIFKIVSDYVTRTYRELKSFKTKELSSRDLCDGILKLLEKVDWLEAFTQLSKLEPDKEKGNLYQIINFIQPIEGTNKLYIYLYHGKELWLGEVNDCLISNEILLAVINYAKLMKTKWIVIKKKKSISINNDFLHLLHLDADYYVAKEIYPDIDIFMAKVIQKIHELLMKQQFRLNFVRLSPSSII